MIENKLANPTAAVQCVSGLRFHLSSGQITGTLASSSGIDRDIFSNGTYTDAPVSSTGWFLQTIGSDLKINDVGGDAPKHTVIGPPSGSNLYSNADNTIIANSRNPHLGPSATFMLTVPGVTNLTSITSVTFQFGTGVANTVTGQVVPEPGSASIVIALGLGVLVRRARTIA